MSDYFTKLDASAKFQTILSMANYYTNTEVNTILTSQYYTQGGVNNLFLSEIIYR